MKIRTVYLKTPNMEASLAFWSAFLETAPTKRSAWWSEFACNNVNFGLLRMDGFFVATGQSSFVPVFEIPAAELDYRKDQALGLGAKVVVDIASHPDHMSYVLADPQGHEFELTKFHG